MKKSFAEVHPHLAVECASGLLETEVVIQLLVRQVAALQGEVVAAVLQGVAQRQAVRQLVGHAALGRGVAQVFPIEGKLVLVEAVVGQRQDIALGKEVVPREGGIEVGVGVGLVGDALVVRHALLLGVAGQVTLGVTGVEVVERAAQTEPTPIAVTGGEVEALGLDAPVVLVDTEAGAAHSIEAALDVVLRVAVDVAALHVEAMPSELAGIAQVEVDVVAVLRTEVGASGFQVLVAEKLVGGGQAIGFFVGKLGLQPVEDEPRARRAIAEGADVLGHVDVAAHAVGTLGDGAAVVLVVVLAEGGEVPPLGGHQAVGQAGDVLARHLGDVE